LGGRHGIASPVDSEEGAVRQASLQDSDRFRVDDYSVDGRTHVLQLGGEVDLYTAPEFKQRLVKIIEGDAKTVLVEVGDVTFLDSTALGVLVGARKKLIARGGSLAIVCPGDELARVFEVSGLDSVFAIYGSRNEALAAVEASD
jgi:anti-sigma B factor antagonist